ncbi:MAG TPA: D-glycero-beta-D-manno-heptose 1-phosphate adenylyltransferase [Saprospiraceae bacterium]|nr:D-glycero-beta-D-manno-heptose 1-phosphate adenylyltransferase [Saprospiraceae bacterium]HMQ81628.1 D-glycero-beta-D-manno-heptose 1-phosphate adenylyltransferase [Saprospiraceae bacterium]
MLSTISKKLTTWDHASLQIQRWQASGEQVVFTNGCFDLIHYGHIAYLAAARALGDHLVVGLNSADSVRRLKGQHRPINDELTRQYTLASFEFVDLVVIFEEDTPHELIQRLLPDILVKGGDYNPENIVGADLVLGKGGKVLTLPFVDGYSTTNVEEKIKNQR